MEIGTWTGDRAFRMIKLAQRYYPADQVEYYGFDLIESMTPDKFMEEFSKWPPAISEVKDKLERTGAKIFLYKGNTLETLPKIAPELPEMDFIFIDGDHSLETIANDWRYASRLMHLKTALVFDDYWPGRTDAGAKVTVDNIDKNQYNVKRLFITDHFKKTDFGELTIKLILVRKSR